MKSKKIVTSNVLRSLQSLFRLSKFLGIFPFNIRDNGNVKLSVVSLIFAILFQLFQLLFTLGFILYRWLVCDKMNFMHEILMQLGQVATQAAQIIHLLNLVINRKRLDEIFQNLILFENIDQPINTHECFWYPTLCCFILIGAPIMESAAEINFAADRLEFIVIIWKWELVFCAIFQFTGLLSICRNCFKALNTNLNNQIKGYSKSEAVEKSEQLVKCCETINKCYGPMLLIILISFFGLITINLYSAYLQWENKWIVFIGVLSAVILFSTFHYLVNACESTAKIANQFNSEIHKSLLQDILNECLANKYSENNDKWDSGGISFNTCENPTARDSLKNLIYQGSLATEAINRKELMFTACGYFTINYSFMCSMIETSATYLLICIEFYEHEEKETYNSNEYDNVTKVTDSK